MRISESTIIAVSFIFVLGICYYKTKKNDQRTYSWKDVSWIILFSYLWSFVNIFVHECGHALTAQCFGIIANKISVGIGWKLLSMGGGEYTKIVFRFFPTYGYTEFYNLQCNQSTRIIILAMGVITQFLFLGLVYWLLKKQKQWRETLIGHFCYHYAIKAAFYLTLVLNFPFVLPKSDWTKVAKILLRKYQ